MTIYNRPRRSGKTQEIIELIDMHTMFGETPIWVVPYNIISSFRLIERLRKRMNIGDMINKNQIIFGSITDHFVGRNTPRHIFIDEYEICNRELTHYISYYYNDIIVGYQTKRIAK